MGIERNNKIDYIKIVKILCLITPAIVSLIVLILVGTIVFGRYFSPYSIEMRINNIEIMGSSILSIIGIAVTVWVGLNIYNVIEKREVEDLKMNVELLEKAVNNIDEVLEAKMLEIIEKQLTDSDTVYNRVQEYLELIQIQDKYDRRDSMLLFLIGQLSNKKDIQFDKEFFNQYIYDINLDVVKVDYAFNYIEEYADFTNSINNFNDVIHGEEALGALKDNIARYKENPIKDTELANDLDEFL